MQRGGRLTFVLVHGGAHGRWCWRRVAEALESLGQCAVAMDLPCENVGAGAAEYADTVDHAVGAGDDHLVLVGHSLGGLTVPVVASRRRAARMIFLASVLPVVGRSLRSQQEEEPEMLFPYVGGSAGFRERFFNRCAPADAEAALRLLRRQALKPFVEITPLVEWPRVPSSYVVCTFDRACNPAWGRRAARERLGVAPVEFASDHSPFLSHPRALAELLVRLARGV